MCHLAAPFLSALQTNSPVLRCFIYGVVLKTAFHLLGCTVMRVTVKFGFDLNSWIGGLRTKNNNNRNCSFIMINLWERSEGKR